MASCTIGGKGRMQVTADFGGAEPTVNSVSFACNCAEKQIFSEKLLDSISVAFNKKKGGSYSRQRGGACEIGSTERNTVRALVLAALTGGTVYVGKNVAGLAIGVATGSATCPISIDTPMLAISTCKQYANLLIWMNSQVLSGKLPFWGWIQHSLTVAGGAVATGYAGTVVAYFIDKIIDIICKAPGFVWQAPPPMAPIPPPDLAATEAAARKAADKLADTLAAAFAAAGVNPEAAARAVDAAVTARLPQADGGGGGGGRGGYRKTKKQRRTRRKGHKGHKGHKGRKSRRN